MSEAYVYVAGGVIDIIEQIHANHNYYYHYF